MSTTTDTYVQKFEAQDKLTQAIDKVAANFDKVSQNVDAFEKALVNLERQAKNLNLIQRGIDAARAAVNRFKLAANLSPQVVQIRAYASQVKAWGEQQARNFAPIMQAASRLNGTFQSLSATTGRILRLDKVKEQFGRVAALAQDTFKKVFKIGGKPEEKDADKGGKRGSKGRSRAGDKKEEDKAKERGDRLDKIRQKVEGIGNMFKTVAGLFASAFILDRVISFFALAIDKVKEFGAAAVQEAAKIERLTATFAALNAAGGGVGKRGALAKASEQMDYIQRFAASALGQFDDLAEAGTRLEASGLVMQRWLPLVSNVAGAFGATKEKIDMLSGALGKLASGSSGEALEVLREFGITRSALENRGIQFDGGGALKSSVEDALLAVEKIANQKFGRIADFMAGTFEQRFSNLQDSWNNLMGSFGKAWLPFAGKLLDTAQKFISYLSDSGWIGNLGKNLAGALEGIMGGVGVPKFIFTAMALAEQLPTAMQKVWELAQRVGDTLSKGFVTAYNFFGKLATNIINLFTNGLASLEDRINKMVSRLVKMFAEVNWSKLIQHDSKAVSKALEVSREFMQPTKKQKDLTFTPIKDPSEIFGRVFGDTQFGKFWQQTQARAGQLEAQYKMAQANGDKMQGMHPSKYAMFNSSYVKATDHLGKIAEATERTAKATERNLDINQFLFGGGDIARNGISLIDVSGSRVPGPSDRGPARIDVRTSPARDSLERAIMEILMDGIGQLTRQGLLGGGRLN